MTAALPTDPLAFGLGTDAPELRGLATLLRLIGDPEQLGQLLRALPGTEASESRLHVGYEEAARRLNIPDTWLRERISNLPHRKLGKYVQFTEADLSAISQMHFVDPYEYGKTLTLPTRRDDTLKPSPSRRRR
ncbi:hypothetical protein ACFYXL_14590 [Streptomyces tsukubensis]|uniref:hypothetical protein n=1 Tax=Streptomyces tsukubensis TaxID=83656 RepID=UPI0036B56795